MGVSNCTAAGGAWIVYGGPVCGAIMGVLSVPQRVEVLSMGGAVESTITGARGCAAGELDWGPGGGVQGRQGACWPGMGDALGGGALSAKSRGRCGGPGEARPLRPTPRSIRGTLGAPEPSPASRPAQKQPRAGAAGEGPWCGGGESQRVRITPTPPLQWGPMFRGPPKS